jgi:predicted ribosome quality control (RQC) complex YloA/Tae2 family protein
VDEPVFFALLAEAAAKPEVKEAGQEKKRLTRLLAKLGQEERRLEQMLELRNAACLLQANLWRFAPDERISEVKFTLDGVPDSEAIHIELDPLLSVRENMQRMFHQSARGARGLAVLAKRRAGLQQEDHGMTADAQASEQPPAPDNGLDVAAAPLGFLPGPLLEGSGPLPSSSAAQTFTQKSIKDIAMFRSSTGHTLLRGKNAQGNQALLKLGQPYDLWLHARGGPSAHLIIRKTHAAEEIPEQTLREAAVLVGEKSWQRNAGKAEIMVALVKHVHPVKGAAPGTVRVDAELQGLTVSLEQIKHQMNV